MPVRRLSHRIILVLTLLFLIIICMKFTALERYTKYGNQALTYFNFESHEGYEYKIEPKDSGEWHIWRNHSNVIYIHRAIYDSRNFSRWQTPAVTLMVLSNTQRHSDLGTIICSYTISNKTVSRTAKVIFPVSGFRYKLTNLQEFAIQCPVDDIYPIPTFITVSRGVDSAILKIERPYPGNEAITVCVPLVYGSFDAGMLIEWFEYLKFFGVSMVEIAMWEVPSSVSQIFDYYEKQGFLLVNKMEIPFKIDLYEPDNERLPSSKPKFLKAFVPIALHECLTMNALRSRYILSLDFDEFIYLNISVFPSFIELVDSYVGNKKTSTVQVQTGKIKFDVTCGRKLSSPHFIISHKFREDFSVMTYNDNPKSFMSTSNCPFIGNHYCMWRNERFQKHYLRVPTSHAFIAHFRKHVYCLKKVARYAMDTTLTEIEPFLVENFNKAKEKLGLLINKN
ncbi:unnamed protein product [Dimorphilus gyrociliatus]|uniref:Glycosyltransferase family 92 protein n=1 Tax=Dimorphilus gyrociliatus TaxID=2664684 RepID=A0A7I8VID9_9ANNE|nr:unnamed protein product [Dimorphilus gyrociliatus]